MRRTGTFARWLSRRASRRRDAARLSRVRPVRASRPAPEPALSETGTSWPELAQCEGKPGVVVELPNSAAEPGGAPVRVDPGMVSPAAAARMRPLSD
jgi:ferric-dicitrate binding protein FerR (iron transport regulator)